MAYVRLHDLPASVQALNDPDILHGTFMSVPLTSTDGDGYLTHCPSSVAVVYSMTNAPTIRALHPGNVPQERLPGNIR